MTTTPTLSDRFAHLRRALRQAREARSARQAASLQLAQFSTPAERLELSAVLRRQSPDRAAQVRSLLRP
jgi:hypothetical protein